MAVKMIHQKNTIFFICFDIFSDHSRCPVKKNVFSLSHIEKNGKCVYITEVISKVPQNLTEKKIVDEMKMVV